MKKHILFFPVETISRELDYKLVLAMQLAREDTLCIVGQHDFIDKAAKITKRGIYIGKNVFKTTFPCELALFKKYKRNKHVIFWLHEEGGIYPGNEEVWKKTLNELLNKSILTQDDAILTWGKFQENFYRTENNNIPVYDTGTPRFDLSNNDLLGNLISQFNRVKNKDYILINTNFSFTNYHSEKIALLAKMIKDEPTTDAKHYISYHYSRELKMFAHFIEAISYLAKKFPKQEFIIRPHPTESSEIYKTLFSFTDNVKVSKRFTSIEWIQCAKLIIQNGCTTAVESYFLDKPIINYYPFDDNVNISITKDLGINCSSKEDLTKLIKEDLSSISVPKDSKILTMISNFNDGPSLPRIISLYDKKILNLKKFEFVKPILFLRLKIIVLTYYLYDLIKIIPRKIFFHQKWKDYLMAKSHFRGLDHREISKKAHFLNSEGKNIELTFFGKEGFAINIKND